MPQMIDGLALGETTPGPLVGVILNLVLRLPRVLWPKSSSIKATPVPQALNKSARRWPTGRLAHKGSGGSGHSTFSASSSLTLLAFPSAFKRKRSNQPTLCGFALTGDMNCPHQIRWIP